MRFSVRKEEKWFAIVVFTGRFASSLGSSKSVLISVFDFLGNLALALRKSLRRAARFNGLRLRFACSEGVEESLI